jgi:ankyrin repeat protein
MDLVDAIEAADLSAVRKILDANPGIESQTLRCGGERAVHYAAWFNKPDIMDELLDRGADINGIDGMGRTALHYAALHSHPEIVQRLVYRKANLNAVDQFGHPPCLYAIRERCPEGDQVFELLTAAGARYDLHSAVAKPDLARVHEILSNEPDCIHKLSNQEQLLLDALTGLADDLSVQPDLLLNVLFDYGLRVSSKLVEDLTSQYGGKISELLQRFAEN